MCTLMLHSDRTGLIMTRVLIVEDDALIGLLLETMLESMDFDVCAVATSENEAVDVAARLQPDLIIADAHLGARGSGINAMARIADTQGAIAHVLISGDRLDSAVLNTPCLRKPFTEDELRRAIGQACHSSNVVS